MTVDKEARLIEDIYNGKFSEAELINLYRNASVRGVSAVMEAVKVKMRADFPRAANRMFGAKESEAVAILEKVFHDLSGTLDFTKNRLKNGVKAGGHMLSGEKYIDVYMSFKNASGVGVFLGLVQDSPDSELIATVGYYKTGSDGFRDVKTFQMHDFEKAVEIYRNELSKVMTDD
jgi:hypothetical protein